MSDKGIRCRMILTMKKPLAKILIAVGLLSAVIILGRSLLYYPNNEVEVDSGLAPSGVVNHPTEMSLPVRLLIPKIGVDAEVNHLGITKSGNMAAPKQFEDVGWYKYGTVPGETGSAVIAGHEDDAIATPAIFYDLHKLRAGDEVVVVGEEGESLRFRVTETKIHPYNLTGPELERIFNADGKRRLNLITCAGDWLPAAKTNDQRLVVYTELID